MTAPTDAELEAAARWLCERLGQSAELCLNVRIENLRVHALMNEALASAAHDASPWRPIKYAPRQDVIEILTPDGDRHFGVIEKGRQPWINSPFIESETWPISRLDSAIERGWLWKNPTPLVRTNDD